MGRGTLLLELNRALPREEVYEYWRTLENLPHFMDHVESVRTLGEGRSHWVVYLSPRLKLEWDAQITADRSGETIAWQSLPDSSVQHEGSVHFKDAPADRGTEVSVMLAYRPPAGVVGAAFESLHSAVTEQQVKEDLRRFKQILEAGEPATIEGQPIGP